MRETIVLLKYAANLVFFFILLKSIAAIFVDHKIYLPDSHYLQQPADNFGQLASLAFPEVDVLEHPLACHLFPQMGKAVRPYIQIWLVNLENISGKHHFRSFAGPCNYGLNLVRGKVLSLIHNEIYISQTPAPDICQRRYHQLSFIQHCINLRTLLACGFETKLLADTSDRTNRFWR